jgi:hypothetical protein
MLQISMPKQPKKTKPRGRPPKAEGAMQQIAIRLPVELLEDIDEMADANRRKRSDAIRLAIEDAVTAWKADRK